MPNAANQLPELLGWPDTMALINTVRCLYWTPCMSALLQHRHPALFAAVQPYFVLSALAAD